MTDKFTKFLRDWLLEHNILNSNQLDHFVQEEYSLNELGMDSLDLVEFIMDLETEYSIKISDDDVSKFDLVNIPFKLLNEYIDSKVRDKYLGK